MKQIICLTFLLFLFSCSSEGLDLSNNDDSYSNWNQYRGSNSKTGFSLSSAPSESPVNLNDNGNFLDIAAGEEVSGSPIIASDKLYITIASIGGGKSLSAINLNNGDLIWRYSIENYILPPTVNDGIIYFVSSKEVIALNTNDGSEIWRTNISIDYYSSPTYHNGILVVSNAALDADTGQFLWKFDASVNGAPNAVLFEAGSFGPSINNDLVFYSGREQFPNFSSKEFIYAVNINNGNEVWRFEIDNKTWGITSIIAISDNIIYFTTNDGGNSYRYAVNATTGQEIWKLENNNYTELNSNPAIGYGKIIINMYGGLYAFDKKTGQEVWNFSPSDSDSANNPVIADNKVFIAGYDFLYAIDVNNGTELWKSNVYSGGLFDTEPVISGGKIIYNNGIDLSILE